MQKQFYLQDLLTPPYAFLHKAFVQNLLGWGSCTMWPTYFNFYAPISSIIEQNFRKHFTKSRFVSRVVKYNKKSFPIWQRLSCQLDEGIAKMCKNWNLTVAFWATCKIGQPIQPIWQQFFALPWSALKKQSWELNFLHIFAVPLSSRHEKCCQILERLFVVFHHSRNILWKVS